VQRCALARSCAIFNFFIRLKNGLKEGCEGYSCRGSGFNLKKKLNRRNAARDGIRKRKICVFTMPHVQQLTAAKSIHRAFLEKRLRYAILAARCQSGKTGAFQELIRRMLATGDIQRAYILCGSNETELYAQAKKDTEEANPAAYEAGEIKVIFRQDFVKSKMELTNCLIVVDESHLDQTQKQELHVFLSQHGLSMDGNPKTLEKENAFILSVSATPYSELAAIAHKETPFEKHVENLEPGDGYFGLAEYKYNNLMRPTFNIAENFTQFTDLFGPPESPKWALVRLMSSAAGNRQEAAINAAAYAHGIKVRYFDTSSKKQVTIDRLNYPPKKHTVVIIRGRLRAGKVVPKQHIAFVWEGAHQSKTDSLVQGLPGRMCGYEFGETKPLIFIPPSSLKNFKNKVVKASEIERAIMEYPYMLPTKATNIKKPRVANIPTNGKTQCVPLRLVPDYDDDEYSPFADNDIGEAKKHFCRDLLLKNIEQIRSSPNYSEEQKGEIISNAQTATPHIRHFDPSGEEGLRLKGVIEAYHNKTATSDNIYDGAEMTFIFMRASRVMMPGANPKHIYVIFHTQSSSGVNPGIESVHLNSRIGTTNRNSNFSYQDEQTDKPLVAGGIVGINATNLENPAALEEGLRIYLKLWKTSPLTVSRCIQSARTRFRISKAAFHWKSKNDSDLVEVLNHLNIEFDIKMKPTYTQGRSMEGFFNLEKITW